MAQNNQRGSKNNNPEGRNQYSYGMSDMARERPFTTAAAAAAAVGAGVFLWSRRNQISEQLSSLSDQIGEWSASSGNRGSELETVGGQRDFGTASAGTSGLSETGGGNASLGAHSGGAGIHEAGGAGKGGRTRA